MDKDFLIAKYPRIYHMAEDNSWRSIEKYGLLSTSALLSLYKYEGYKKMALECEWRPKRHILSCQGLEDAVLRDQKPMSPPKLKACLIDMECEEWYKLVNSMVFFWVEWRPSLEWFLGSREYRNKKHTVISVNTKSLVNRYHDKIFLSGINSGSTYYLAEKSDGPPKRNRSTFQRIHDYTKPWIRELSIEHGVPDIGQHVVSVGQWISDGNKCRKIKDIYP